MEPITIKRLLPRCAGLLGLLLLVFTSGGHAADPVRRMDFDHLRTGFPLTGAHAHSACENCHVSGIFRGTPKQCEYCHMRGSRIPATPKPSNHVMTFEPCDQCHRSAITWAGARFSHISVAPGSCNTCHCITATCKPAKHIQTTATCDTCHRTLAWIPARFNHADVAPGTCTSCHGITATGKPSRHPQTSAQCDDCHRTTAWLPASFNHASVAPGSCNGCHGVSATGKPSGHFVTSLSCDSCHTTSSWINPRYTHTSPYYRAHSSGVTCRSCHSGNTEAANWTYATYKPDCAGCHAGKFKPDAHKKTEVPTKILYTVAELKDCAGSCHEYTDNTFTTIKKTRSGEHRSTSGGF